MIGLLFVILFFGWLIHAAYVELTWDYNSPEARYLLLKKIIREEE